MILNSEKRCWYLIATKPQSEIKAQQNLLRQGYEVYLPLVQISRRCNGQNIQRTEALFPRYIFIYLDVELDNWSPIRSTIGVTGMVRFGGVSAVVPTIIVDKLKKNENEFGLQLFNKKELRLGDKVDIIDGPFEGLKAVYQKMKSMDRISVLLDIIGKNTQVTLSMHELEIV